MGGEQTKSYCVLFLLPDDEVDPESAVGPLVLLPELLLLLPELLLPAVLPLFAPVPPP